MFNDTPKQNFPVKTVQSNNNNSTMDTVIVTWQCLKTYVVPVDTVTHQTKVVDGADDLITDKSEISQLLLEQFSSVFSSPSTDKKVTDPDSFFTYNIDGKPLLTDIIIDDEHIVSAVKEMSVSSSAGPDGLPSFFLKNCLPVLIKVIKPLKILFRKSLDSGDIPAIFKRAAIVPIFKGGDRTCPPNYRPISLAPVLMKLFERIIRK